MQDAHLHIRLSSRWKFVAFIGIFLVYAKVLSYIDVYVWRGASARVRATRTLASWWCNDAWMYELYKYIYACIYIYISRFKTSIYTNKGIVLYKIYRRVINIHTWYFGTFNLNRVEILFLRRSYWKVFWGFWFCKKKKWETMVLSFFFWKILIFFVPKWYECKTNKKKKKKVGHGCCVFSHFAGFSLIE